MMKTISIPITLILGFVLVGTMAVAAPVAPQVPNGTDSGVTARVFKDFGHFVGLVQGESSNQDDNRIYQAVQLGAYYDLSDNWSFGAFYRHASGLRHDNDWEKVNGQWSWVDTRHRGEDILMLDATGKMLLEFLTLEHWVGEFKVRYLDNLYTHDQDLMVRPGLTYFWLRAGHPFMNFFVQYEADLALSYASHQINERWLYFGGLYRVNSNLDLGASFADKWQSWHSSRAYLDKGGAPYTVSATTRVLSALLVLHF